MVFSGCKTIKTHTPAAACKVNKIAFFGAIWRSNFNASAALDALRVTLAQRGKPPPGKTSELPCSRMHWLAELFFCNSGK